MIQRWNIDYKFKDDDGDHVTYADHLAEVEQIRQAERQRIVEAVKALGSQWGHVPGDWLVSKADVLAAIKGDAS